MDAAAFHRKDPTPPRLDEEAWATVEHGCRRTDPYHGLGRLEDPRLRAYLEANNRHAEAVMREAAPLRRAILEELRRLTPDDEGPAAWRRGRDWFRTRWDPGQDHPVFVRRAGAPDGPETVLIDGPALAREHPAFGLADVQVAPDGGRLAFTFDPTGRKLHELRFREMAGERDGPDRLSGVEALTAWAADSRTILYVRADPVTLRPCRVFRHRLGDDPSRDALVYEEGDEAFRCFVCATRSGRWILIHSYAADAEEVRLLDAAAPDGQPVVVCPRASCAYEVDDDGTRILILTDRDAPTFRVVEADSAAAPPEAWRPVVAAAPGYFIEQAAGFRDYLALIERGEGRQRVRIVDRADGASHEIRFPEPVEHLWVDANPDPASRLLRLGGTSLVTPVSYYDYDMSARDLRLVQRERIPGYDPAAYETRRLWIPARDGTAVPVTVAGRREVLERGGAPALLFAYGAYGTSIPVYFDQSRLVLFERGWLYAMVHVRGGGELGPAWHRAGRLGHKSRSITDCIDAAEHLARLGLVRPDRLCAESLSAGGLVLGAVMNRRPDLFRAVVLREPFVDLLNSLSDPDLPLTVFEYGEWGDPRRPEEWAWMRAYSPYDNVAPRAYPHLLATAAWEDRQVPCWEQAKWVARLRASAVNRPRLLLVTQVQAGHGGPPGRYARLPDLALIYTFLLDAVRAPDGSYTVDSAPG